MTTATTKVAEAVMKPPAEEVTEAVGEVRRAQTREVMQQGNGAGTGLEGPRNTAGLP